MEGKGGGRRGGAQAFNSSMNTITTTSASSSTPPPTTTREGDFVEQQQAQGLPRRRTGSHKRKANTSNNSSAAAKRQARERTFSAIPLHLHNGPITRARQSPNKSALLTAAEASVSASAAAAVVSVSTSGSPLTQNPADLSLLQVPSTSGGEVTNATQESKTAFEELQAAALEPDIDAEFEAIRSRES